MPHPLPIRRASFSMDQEALTQQDLVDTLHEAQDTGPVTLLVRADLRVDVFSTPDASHGVLPCRRPHSRCCPVTRYSPRPPPPPIHTHSHSYISVLQLAAMAFHSSYTGRYHEAQDVNQMPLLMEGWL